MNNLQSISYFYPELILTLVIIGSIIYDLFIDKSFSGRVGWISKSQLSRERHVITILPDQYLYKFPTNNSKKIATVKMESLLKIVKENEGWLLLESDGVKGWITKDAVWGLN